MGWVDLLENPEAIRTIFTIEPSLSSVELMSVNLDRNGPTITLGIRLNEYPNNPPSRWQKFEANQVTVKLEILGVKSVSVEGWTITNQVVINIDRISDELYIAIEGSGVKLKITAGWLRVQGLDASHRRNPEEQNY